MKNRISGISDLRLTERFSFLKTGRSSVQIGQPGFVACPAQMQSVGQVAVAQQDLYRLALEQAQKQIAVRHRQRELAYQWN